MNQQVKQKIRLEVFKCVAHIPLQTSIFFCGGLFSYGLHETGNSDLGNWIVLGSLVGALQGASMPLATRVNAKHPNLGPMLWVLAAFLSIPAGALMLDCFDLTGMALLVEAVGVSLLCGLFLFGVGCLKMCMECRESADDVNQLGVMIELPAAVPVVVADEAQPQIVPSRLSLFQPAAEEPQIEQERPVAYAVMVPRSS